MKICPNGHKLGDKDFLDDFICCPLCGEQLVFKIEKFFCKKCGNEVDSNWICCPKCGSKIHDDDLCESDINGDAKDDITDLLIKYDKITSDPEFDVFECEKSAKSGYVPAIEELFSCYLLGEHVEQNHDKAYELAKVSYDKNKDYRLAYMLADCYRYGHGCEKDLKKAISYYKSCIGKCSEDDCLEDGDIEYDIAQCFDELLDYESAIEWYKKAVENNNSEAAHDLAFKYINGDGVEKDENKGFEILSKALEVHEDDVWLNYRMGICLKYGCGCEENDKKAIKYFKQASDGGLPRAKNELAWMYINGEGVEKDENEGFEILSKALEENEDSSFLLNSLGVCLCNGIGCDINEEKAFKLFNRSAALEYLDGVDNLAYCYFCGIGCDKNEEKGYEILLNAYNNIGSENIKIIRRLAYCYFNALGVEENYELAFELYKKLAEKNDPEGLYGAGYCLYKGYGIDCDKENGLAYINQSAELGYEDAIKFLKKNERFNAAKKTVGEIGGALLKGFFKGITDFSKDYYEIQREKNKRDMANLLEDE